MTRKYLLITLLSALVLMGSQVPRSGVDPNAIPGRIIVQFDKGNNTDAIREYLEQTYAFAGLVQNRCLSDRLGIYIYTHTLDTDGSELLLKRLRREKDLANVQSDHRISLREVIPNDSQFSEQWALRNTGQTGGTSDADIDATDAWEVTVNNGTSVMGDTIVMAIVDDGFSMIHPDLHYWKNRLEIPNNGVDDDGNGYVDDFDGWNAYYHSGYIQPKDHGQHVAGIAGAIGDNGIGVCGVNWYGRVMTVCGSSEVESTVVEAYAYVYTMRSLYDATSGQKGAYVVATNSSFGVDLGDPDDYPIWGAMYDSLGSLGILSAAATSNATRNVDVVGDIPTTFPSDYLISVTNTTQDDEKNIAAGYGPINIDLGAPGKNILSTRIPDTYGYKTGTSMASPHVTGSIALMYAAADAAFFERYQQDPPQLAVFLKNIILDAADTIPGFDTLCVSGGRLNVNNAIQKLINPRIAFQDDTVFNGLEIDSLAELTFRISNIVGFNLPYEAEIMGAPGWISFDQPSGSLPGGGSEELNFHFDATGLDQGMYDCAMIFTDIAGMADTLPIRMEVFSSQGLDEADVSGQARCFPNPFSSYLNVEYFSDRERSVMIHVYSVAGEMVLVTKAHLHTGRNLLGINGSSFRPGVYVVHVAGDDIRRSFRVIRVP